MDFASTDNTCRVQTDSEKVLLREKFVGSAFLSTEAQLQQAARAVKGSSTNSVKAQRLFFEGEAQVSVYPLSLSLSRSARRK